MSETSVMNAMDDVPPSIGYRNVHEICRRTYGKETKAHTDNPHFPTHNVNWGYFANTPAYFYGMSNAEALEELYLTFNLRRPADFRGHSLSVSDVVVLNREGQAGAFYVDRIGFKELPGFLEQMKEAARPQKSMAAQVKQAKEAAPRVKTKKHKERDAR